MFKTLNIWLSPRLKPCDHLAEEDKEKKKSFDVPWSSETRLPTRCARCRVMESLLCDEYLMCFGLFHTVGNSPRRKRRNPFIAAVVLWFNKLDA